MNSGMCGGSRALCLMSTLHQLKNLSCSIRKASSLSNIAAERSFMCTVCYSHKLLARNSKASVNSRMNQTLRSHILSGTTGSHTLSCTAGLHTFNSQNNQLFQKASLHANENLIEPVFVQTLPTLSVTVRGMKTDRNKKVVTKVDEHINPIDKLQQYVAVPLLKDKDRIFKPSQSEVAAGQRLFLPSVDHKIEFLQSAMLEEQLPIYELPEVAFIGRSNVGKSTLISMLLSHTDVMVKCSKHPGHTKLLNFFQVGESFTLVDMPGYGFNMPKYYTELVEKFLASRKKLSRTFILIDGTVGVTETDVIGLNMLEEFHIPYVIVMTKIDKAKPASLIKNLMTVLKYRDQTNHCFPQPFLVSSTRGEGVPLLQAFIAYVTGNLAVEGL